MPELVVAPGSGNSPFARPLHWRLGLAHVADAAALQLRKRRLCNGVAGVSVTAWRGSLSYWWRFPRGNSDIFMSECSQSPVGDFRFVQIGMKLEAQARPTAPFEPHGNAKTRHPEYQRQASKQSRRLWGLWPKRARLAVLGQLQGEARKRK